MPPGFGEDTRWTLTGEAQKVAGKQDKDKKPEPKKQSGPRYDVTDFDRIPATLKRIAALRDVGAPTLSKEINLVNKRAAEAKGQDADEIQQRTVGRFLAGHKIEAKSLRLIEFYIEDRAPPEPIEIFGDALADFLGEAFTGLLGDPNSPEALARTFAKAYDCFLEGRLVNSDYAAMERGREDGRGVSMDEAQKLAFPEREYVWDRPFEIPFSRIFLQPLAGTNWLRTTEFVTNAEMSAEQGASSVGKTYDGVLSYGDVQDRFLLFAREPDFGEPRILILEPQSHLRQEPAPAPLVGSMIFIGVEGYITPIRSAQVRLMPVEGAGLIGGDQDG